MISTNPELLQSFDSRRRSLLHLAASVNADSEIIELLVKHIPHAARERDLNHKLPLEYVLEHQDSDTVGGQVNACDHGTSFFQHLFIARFCVGKYIYSSASAHRSPLGSQNTRQTPTNFRRGRNRATGDRFTGARGIHYELLCKPTRQRNSINVCYFVPKFCSCPSKRTICCYLRPTKVIIAKILRANLSLQLKAPACLHHSQSNGGSMRID